MDPKIPALIDVLLHNDALGPLERVREVLGPGCELCLALACPEAPKALSQRDGGIPRHNKLYFMSMPSLCTFTTDSLGLLEVRGGCTLAAKHGLLGALTFLRWRVCDWNVLTCMAAADGGHLEVQKWLGRPGKPEELCAWDSETCTCAARSVCC